MLLDSPARRRRRRPRVGRWLAALAILAMIGSGVYLWRSQVEAADARQEAAERFATAWAERDHAAMWRELTPRARAANPQRRFAAAYANAEREAGVRAVEIGRIGDERDGRVVVPVSIRTDVFGALRGTIALPVSGTGDEAGVDWDYSLRLPGLRRDEAVVRRSGPPPRAGVGARRRRRAPAAERAQGRAREDVRRPAHRPRPGAAAVRRPRGGAHPRRPRPVGEDDDRAGAQPRGVGGAGRPARRHRRDPAARRRRARARRAGGVGAAAAGLGVQDHHRGGGAGQADRAAVDDVSGPDRGDARGRHAPQRGRRGLRRLARQLVRALVQLRVRAAGREAGRAPAGGRRRGVRVRQAAADPERQAEHDRASAARRPRGRRRSDRPGPRPRHASGDGRASARRSRPAAGAPSRASRPCRRSSAAARSRGAPRARCGR